MKIVVNSRSWIQTDRYNKTFLKRYHSKRKPDFRRIARENDA